MNHLKWLVGWEWPAANIGDSFALFEPVQLQKLLIILMKIEIL